MATAIHVPAVGLIVDLGLGLIARHAKSE